MENATRVELPRVVRPPYEVFVNGLAQTEGTDFNVFGSTLVFGRRLTRQRELSWWRWVLLFFGVWSSYRHFDTIDVVYTADGRRLVATLAPTADGGSQ